MATHLAIPQRRFLPLCCETTPSDQEDQAGKKDRAFGSPEKTSPSSFEEEKEIPKMLFQEAHV